MGRIRLIGASLIVAGLPVMIWAPNAFPVVGVLMAVVGLALLARGNRAAGAGPASSSPHADLLWRGGTGGPPNPPRDSGMHYPRI